jgi:hypothetical protein
LFSDAAKGELSSEVASMRFSNHMMIEMLVANGNLLTLHAQAQHMSKVASW